MRWSLVVFGPAVTVALIPSAVAVWPDPWSAGSLTRFLVVMAVGTLLLLAGIRRSLLGVVVPAALALAIAAGAQIWETLDLFPRWVALTVVGGVLIVLGARIEALRRRGEQAQGWLHSMK
jgi:hypothetical protein